MISPGRSLTLSPTNNKNKYLTWTVSCNSMLRSTNHHTNFDGCFCYFCRVFGRVSGQPRPEGHLLCLSTTSGGRLHAGQYIDSPIFAAEWENMWIYVNTELASSRENKWMGYLKCSVSENEHPWIILGYLRMLFQLDVSRNIAGVGKDDRFDEGDFGYNELTFLNVGYGFLRCDTLLFGRYTVFTHV